MKGRHWVIGFVAVLALSLEACGGSAGDGSDAGGDFGWCCDGVCGLDAESQDIALTEGYTCECAGIVRGSTGECEPDAS